MERLDLLKNVHVVIRDVGKSGIMPGSVQAKKAAPAKGRAKTDIFRGPDQQAAQPAEPVEPTPLDLRCDSKMQVFLPKPQRRCWSVPPRRRPRLWSSSTAMSSYLRGKPDARPDQLTCDTLKLSLIPSEKPPQIGKSAPAPSAEQSPATSD